ncbi:MAG: hypothetical protein ACRD0W_15295 [Acidimicrobiales bacterium]
MTNTLPDRWASQDLPVLRRAAQILEVEGGGEVRPEGIAADLDITEDAALRSLLALQDAGYVVGANADSLAGRYVIVTDLAERGRRAAGIWPSEDSVDALIDALERAADEADDPEEKSRLNKLATGFRDVGKRVVAATIAAYIAGQLPR